MSNLLDALRANLPDQLTGQYLDELRRVLNVEQGLRAQDLAIINERLEARIQAAETALADLRQDFLNLTRDDRYQLTKAKVVRLLKANNLYDEGAS